MKKSMILASGLAFMSAPAMSQDIPLMFAKCGGVFEALYQFQPPEGNHGPIGQAAQILRNQASAQASVSGPSVVAEVGELYETTLEFWSSQGVEVATTEDFANWMVRCRDFAIDHEVDLGL